MAKGARNRESHRLLLLLFFFFTLLRSNSVQPMLRHPGSPTENLKSTAHPVHLHVLELQAKVVALDEVAPQEDLGEEGLSQSLRLEERGRGKKIQGASKQFQRKQTLATQERVTSQRSNSSSSSSCSKREDLIQTKDIHCLWSALSCAACVNGPLDGFYDHQCSQCSPTPHPPAASQLAGNLLTFAFSALSGLCSLNGGLITVY